MEDRRLTPKAVLPGELNDADERDAVLREVADIEDKLFAPTEPPPGSWAATARLMASSGVDDGFDWDVWKDEMKERDHFGD